MRTVTLYPAMPSLRRVGKMNVTTSSHSHCLALSSERNPSNKYRLTILDNCFDLLTLCEMITDPVIEFVLLELSQRFGLPCEGLREVLLLHARLPEFHFGCPGYENRNPTSIPWC